MRKNDIQPRWGLISKFKDYGQNKKKQPAKLKQLGYYIKNDSHNYKVGTLTTDTCIALTTCPDADIAAKLATAIVEARLAACVNIIPAIESVYRWQGKIEQDTESLLLLKTSQQNLPALESLVKQQHPYELPEFIALDINHGSQAYLEWIKRSLEK